RTEGWIAGLQLAAISMQGQPDPHTFVQSFTGSHRFIVDYLVDEVLNQQPDPVRDFLFQTSILDRLSASLCDAVTGRDDGQAMLEQLERNNMLIVPLDNQRQWYRYHHLFAEVLQTYAHKADPNNISVWQKRASLWCEQNGFRSDAIHYAFTAGDVDHAASLVERTWPEMFYGVRPMTWLEWAQKLPHEAVQVRPVLSAACAWMLLDKGELAPAEAHLQNVTQWLERINTSGQSEAKRLGMVVANEVEFQSLVGSTASAYAYPAQAQGDLQDTINHARRSLTSLSPNDHYWRGTTTLFLGLAQWANGDLTAAHASMKESVDHQRKSCSHYFETFGTAILGDIRAAQGRLHNAHTHYRQALAFVSVEAVELGDQTTPSRQVIQGPVALYVGLAELFREWDDLEIAAQYLQFGREVVEHAILPGSAYRLWCTVARLHVAKGAFDLAL
ncbi:MAG: helix-turn-helix transcriptional regulator, partial [Anaerolineae bacterium]|nr:helix-turn-helix transcriptional regulator [Anaerolineae bacterium]